MTFSYMRGCASFIQCVTEQTRSKNGLRLCPCWRKTEKKKNPRHRRSEMGWSEQLRSDSTSRRKFGPCPASNCLFTSIFLSLVKLGAAQAPHSTFFIEATPWNPVFGWGLLLRANSSAVSILNFSIKI